MLKKILIIVGLAVLTTACSNNSGQAQNGMISESDDAELTGLIAGLDGKKGGVYPKLRTNRPKSGLIGDKALAQVYNEWVGTRYRMGALQNMVLIALHLCKLLFSMLTAWNFHVQPQNNAI